jgi:molybdopterin molybdotransferase
MGTVDFARVAMRPGEVHGVGSLGASNVPLIALPGEPLAAFVGFELFVRPVLRRLMGHSDVFGPRRSVALTHAVDGARTLSTVVPVALSGDSATPLGPGVWEMERCDALALIPPGQARVDAGQRLTAVPLEGR